MSARTKKAQKPQRTHVSSYVRKQPERNSSVPKIHTGENIGMQLIGREFSNFTLDSMAFARFVHFSGNGSHTHTHTHSATRPPQTIDRCQLGQPKRRCSSTSWPVRRSMKTSPLHVCFQLPACAVFCLLLPSLFFFYGRFKCGALPCICLNLLNFERIVCVLRKQKHMLHTLAGAGPVQHTRIPMTFARSPIRSSQSVAVRHTCL